MNAPETLLFMTAVAMYALSFFSARTGGSSKKVLRIIAAGLAFHFAAAAVRWMGTGHPPIFGSYEAALSASWFLILFTAFAFSSAHGHFRLMVLCSVPVALLLLLYGLSFGAQRMPLTISEISLWVDLHALFAWLAFAPFTLAFCLSGLYLWRTERTTVGNPRPEIVDELAFRYINIGFINHSVMFALGCYYSSILFGTWWRWDPVFSISLVNWLSVALYIHMRLFYGWHGRRAARLFAFIFATVVIAYWALVFLPTGSTFHVFDIDLKAL